MKILDLSSYQTGIDFDTIVADGYQGVILRGILQNYSTDKCFNKFYQEAERRGLLIGLYTYSYDLCEYDALKRSSLTKGLMEGKDFKLGFFLDLEYSKQRTLPQEVLINIIHIYENAIPSTCIYSNLDWYCNVIPVQFRDTFDFWIARYPNTKNIDYFYKPDPNYKPNVKNLIGWQYSSRCNVGGITCDVSEWYAPIKQDTYPNTVYGLQKYINSKYNENLKVDGIYGPKTHKATLSHFI